MKKLLLTSVAALALAPSAAGNGIDLSATAGKPGQEIAVAGHIWVTCCPTRAYDHVRLFLLAGFDRIDLFDHPPDRFGTVFSSFEVPDVEPGSYNLEACGSNDPNPDDLSDCRPAGTFQVLAGASSGGFGGVGLALGIGLPLLALVAGTTFLVFRRTRRAAP